MFDCLHLRAVPAAKLPTKAAWLRYVKRHHVVIAIQSIGSAHYQFSTKATHYMRTLGAVQPDGSLYFKIIAPPRLTGEWTCRLFEGGLV